MSGQRAIEQRLTMTRTCWFWLMVGMVQLVIISTISAQNLISGDPSDSYSEETLFVNPAVVPFHRHQIMVGMKVYQLGFLKGNDFGLRSSYIGYSLPEESLGLLSLAVTGQNFTAPLYGQTNFSLVLAKQPIQRVAVGLRYNLFTKSYHQKYFDMTDPGDPVFADGTVKFAQSIGAGVIFFPWSTVAVGFSCDHLNRPDISLSKDEYRQPLIYDWGVSYSWRWFTGSLSFNYMQRHWQTNLLVEARPVAFSALRVGVVQQAAKIGARFEVSPRLSFNYNYDYPLYEINRLSSGSHQISIIYQLGHDENFINLTRSRYDEGHFLRFDIEPQFFVDIETEKLEILAQQINHSVAEDVPVSALKNLDAEELAINDSLVEVSKLYNHGGTTNQRLPKLITASRYSKKYESWLAENLLQRKIASVRFIPEESAIERAKHLRDYMINHAPFLANQIQFQPMLQLDSNRTTVGDVQQLSSRQYHSLTPKSVHFKISSVKMRKYHGQWKLEVRDGNHQIIKTFAAEAPVPKSVHWDWRDDHGNIIRPDVYSYAFYWQDKQGQWQHSDEKFFFVQKISRRLEIDIRSQPKPEHVPGGIVEIKFVN